MGKRPVKLCDDCMGTSNRCMETAQRAVELVLLLQGNRQRTCQRCGVILHGNRQQTCQSEQTRYLSEFVEMLHVHSQGACQSVCDCCMKAVKLPHVDVLGVMTACDPAKVWPKFVKLIEDCMGTKGHVESVLLLRVHQQSKLSPWSEAASAKY